MVGINILNILTDVHKKHIVHRDLKPENFLIDAKGNMTLIDFGLSKRYIDTRGRHIPRQENKSFRGTLRYCSINMHLGVENSRRDDLESLGYVIIYCAKGKLPWQGIKTEANLRAKAIARKKIKTPLDQLCLDIPSEIYQYMKISRDLGFDEAPDYGHLKKLLESALLVNGFE